MKRKDERRNAKKGGGKRKYRERIGELKMKLKRERRKEEETVKKRE